MNLFESSISTNRQSINNTYTPSVTHTGAASVAKLSVGQTFSGEITDISKGVVTIRLDNGQSMQAKLKEQYQFNVGERITFQVKSNTSSLIEIKPVIYGESGIAPTALKALTAAGIPVNDTTLELLKSLMNQQMPIDKNSLSNMYKLVLANNTTSPQTIVEMTKLQLPVTKENIAQFENYKSFNHQISSLAENIGKELPKMLMELSTEGNSGAKGFHGQLLDLALPQISNEGNNPLLTAVNTLNDVADATVMKETFQTQNLQEGAILGTTEALEENGRLIAGNLSELGEEQAIWQDVISGEKKLLGSNAENINLNELLGRDALRELADAFKGTALNDNAISMLSRGNVSVKEFISMVKTLLQNGENLSGLMENKAYHRILGIQIENNLLISPEDVAEKDNIEAYYSRLKEYASGVSKMLEAVGKDASVVAKEVTNLSENINFMEQLNQMFNYVQLPLKMSGQEAHGDLYVFTKKKNLLAKEGKITALLHLDMTNLGDMDIYIELEKNNVNASFRMENEESLNLLEKNIGQLTDSLTKRGYVSTTEFVVKKEENGFIENIIDNQQIKHNTPMQRYSFDVKA